jgi:hypothetical protein
VVEVVDAGQVAYAYPTAYVSRDGSYEAARCENGTQRVRIALSPTAQMCSRSPTYGPRYRMRSRSSSFAPAVPLPSPDGLLVVPLHQRLKVVHIRVGTRDVIPDLQFEKRVPQCHAKIVALHAIRRMEIIRHRWTGRGFAGWADCPVPAVRMRVRVK